MKTHIFGGPLFRDCLQTQITFKETAPDTLQISVCYRSEFCISLITCKFDVELVLRLEDLNVEGAVWSKVFDSPGPQDSLVVLWRGEMRWEVHRNGKKWLKSSSSSSSCSSFRFYLLSNNPLSPLAAQSNWMALHNPHSVLPAIIHGCVQQATMVE